MLSLLLPHGSLLTALFTRKSQDRPLRVVVRPVSTCSVSAIALRACRSVKLERQLLQNKRCKAWRKLHINCPHQCMALATHMLVPGPIPAGHRTLLFSPVVIFTSIRARMYTICIFQVVSQIATVKDVLNYCALDACAGMTTMEGRPMALSIHNIFLYLESLGRNSC